MTTNTSTTLAEPDTNAISEPTGSNTVRTTISDFISLVETDDSGNVIYPDEVAGYRKLRQQLTHDTVFAAPIGADQSSDRVEEKKYMVGIHSPTGEDHYEVCVEIGRKFSGFNSPGVMETGETAREAAENAVEWMEDHPAPDVQTIYRPGDDARQPASSRYIGNHADRIRAGSRVYVDSLPPAQVVGEVDTSDLAVCLGTVWECELMKQPGETFHLHVSNNYTPVVSYAGSLAYYSARTRVEHLTVDNEENLRESVNRPLYRFLKNRQGERVIRQTDDHRLKVIEVENLRDGFLNPSSDEGLDPDGYTSATHIGDDTDIDNWYDNEVGLPTGDYEIRGNGVVDPDDTYAVDPVLPADEWDAFGAFGATEDATETTTTLSNPLTADRSGLSRDDDVTDITGVGPSTAENMWHETVGELYDAGFPAAFAPGQYTDKVIADLYTLPDTPTANDAARAVVGVLGGAGFDTDDENIGTVASMITDSIDAEELRVGWLGHQRIKAELTPSWIDADDGPTALGAGRITVSDITDAVDGKIDTERESVTELRKAAVGHDGKVALSTDEGNYIEIRESVLQTAATVADVELSQLGEDGNHVTIFPGEDRQTGEGVVFVSSSDRPFNAVIDTNGFVDASDL